MPDAGEHFHEGNRRLAARDYRGAEACFRRAVVLAPHMAEAHANLAWVLEQDRRDEAAEAGYRRALALQPGSIDILINHGAFLGRLRRLDEAQAQYRRALDIDPLCAPAWSNLAALHAQAGRFEQAEDCCRRALAIDPEHAGAHVNLAYICLRAGRFEEGWRHQHWRRLPYAGQALGDGPRWCGESLEGKSLLIGPEGGHGDMIQFCRYVPLLKRRGARRVVILCQAALCTLLASIEGVDEVVAAGAAVPRCDLWVPLLSLPGLCDTRLQTIPASIPYLAAPASGGPALLPARDGQSLRVGLAWQGNPRHANDDQRSIHDPEVLAPLGAVAGLQWIEIQHGASDSHRDALRRSLGIVQSCTPLESFADTARLLAGLDLVITVDSAVAHLAGALGRSCWVLLPWHMADWRWLSERTDSPWYPGVMRLFRQSRHGDWPGVIDGLAGALRQWVAQRG